MSHEAGVTEVNGQTGVATLTATDVGAYTISETDGLLLTKLTAAQNLSDLINVATARGNLGLGALAQQNSILANQISNSSPDSQNIITALSYAAIRALLDLEIGIDVQAHATNLDAFSALIGAADLFPYFTGVGALSLATVTSFARTILDDTTDAAVRATILAQLAIAQGREASAGTTFLALPGCIIFNTTTQVLTNGRIYYQPIEVFTQITIDQLNIEVTGAGGAGTVAHLYIYDMNTSRQPVARVLDAGTVLVDGLGVKTASVSQILAPGRYIMALISNSTATLRAWRASMLTTGVVPAMGANSIATDLRVDLGAGVTTIPDPGTNWTAQNLGSGGLSYLIIPRISVP